MKEFLFGLLLVAVGWLAGKALYHLLNDPAVADIKIEFETLVSEKEKSSYLQGADDVLACMLESLDKGLIGEDKAEETKLCFLGKTNKFFMEGPKEETIEPEDETTL